MASRNFYAAKDVSGGAVRMVGSFAPNGSSAVDATSRQGRGWSVARTGVGTFVVTLNDKYSALVSGRATLQLNALADSDVMLGPVDMSARTVTVLVKTAGAAADIAANANNRIHFELTLRNSDSTNPARG